MSKLDKFRKGQFGFKPLSKMVDHFCEHSFNNDRKYFPNLLRIAEFTWKQMYWNDLRIPRQKVYSIDKSNNTIPIPADSLRIVGLDYEDNCKHWQPLYVDPYYNTFDPPKATACGCTACDCSGELCGVMNNLIYSEEEFELRPNDMRIRTIRTKVCENGELIKEISEPYLKSIENDGIEIRSRIERVDTLDMKPCGCIDNTPANMRKCAEHCGHPILHAKHQCCRPTTIPLEHHVRGRYVIDEVKGIIHILDCTTDKAMVTFVSNGETCGEEIMIPEYAEESLLTGLFWRSIRFRATVGAGEKKQARIEHIDAVQDMIEFLNPIVPHEFIDLQNRPFKW